MDAAAASASSPPRTPSESASCRIGGQFIGEYQGAEWNAQALLARLPHRHHAKKRYLFKILRGRDFVIATECHGNRGEIEAMPLPPGVRLWSSPGTTKRAGVALLIKESFLSNFDKPSPESWVEILPGRAAMLKLRGDKGALDIVGVYFQTGSSETGEEKAGSEVHKSLKRQRQELRASIARRLSPRSEALTVLAGDFNTVVDDQGRWSSDSNSYSGARDRCEEDDWHNTVEVPFGLFELEQDEFTFEGASGRSRLDRIYTNHYVADQLDRKFGAAALEWVPRLSSHRAIAFARSNKVKDDPENRPIPDHIVLDPKWALRVSVLFSFVGHSGHEERQAAECPGRAGAD